MTSCIFLFFIISKLVGKNRYLIIIKTIILAFNQGNSSFILACCILFFKIFEAVFTCHE